MIRPEFQVANPDPGLPVQHAYIHVEHNNVCEDTRGQHGVIEKREIENVRLYLHTARRRSLGACLSMPQPCGTGNLGGRSSRISKIPGLEQICGGVESSCLKSRVKAHTRQRMDVDFRRRDDLGEVALE